MLDSTLQKLDTLTRAIEQGKFDETLGKIQFIDSLKGESDAQGEFKKLFDEVRQLRTDLTLMMNNYVELRTDLQEFAKVMRAIIELNKKLEWNKANIESTCNKYNAY